MRLTAFLLTIFLTGLAQGHCFREHLREAIALNAGRADRYASLTEGASRAVSDLLIRTERRMLYGSYLLNLDLLARPYEKAGIGVTCEAYVSMSLTPTFRDRFVGGPVPPENDSDLGALRIGERLREAFASRDDSRLLLESLAILKEMSGEPRLHCMTRHLVESIARIAALIPVHEERALELRMRSPRPLHRLMLRGHLGLIEKTRRIDELAKPVNKAGIPLICQDVPPLGPLPR